MARRCLRVVALMTVAFRILPLPVIAESLPETREQPVLRIRTTDARLIEAFACGLRLSATFRDLVHRVNASDVIVYVNAESNLPAGIDGRLTFLSASGGVRYVIVQVNARLPRPRLVALLGHELQHAREIADTVSIVDAVSLAREYAARLGYATGVARREPATFDSRAAVQAGETVLREMLN